MLAYIYRRPILLPILLLLIIYLFNAFGPLRLTNDTVRYFVSMERMLGTWPVAIPSHHDFLPYGYVSLLAMLDKLGILRSPMIVIVQLGYLVGSIYFFGKIFKAYVNFYLFAFFLLCSWLSMKFTLFPLSEMQFLFFSSASLYYYQQWETKKIFRYLLMALVFSAAAILTRTAGLVLLPAFALAFMITHRVAIGGWMRSNKILSVSMMAALIILVLAMGLRSDYMNFIWAPFHSNPWLYPITCFATHLADWGEPFVNLPMSKISGYVSQVIAKSAYISVGVIFLLIILHALFIKKLLPLLHVRIYFILYIIEIFNWPYFESRFWFPVLPIMIFILLRYTGKAAVVYRTWYLTCGLFALTYYSYLSFHKDVFAVKHDAGLWKAEYEWHFFRKPPASGSVNPQAIYVLEKYD